MPHGAWQDALLEAQVAALAGREAGAEEREIIRRRILEAQARIAEQLAAEFERLAREDADVRRHG